MGRLNWGKKQEFISPQVNERIQWASTRECLKVLTGDYLKEYRYPLKDFYIQIKENGNDLNLVGFYSRLIDSFTQMEQEFLALPPATRIKKLNIDVRVDTPVCPLCFGEGGTPSEWCDFCGGWGYNVKHIFEYLDSMEEPGLVIYKVRNGMTVDIISFGTRVTVEI